MTTVFKASIRNFQELIRVLVPTKRISRNFYFGGLRSCKFWDLTIIWQWGNVQMPFFPKSTSNNVLPVSRYSYTGPLSMICVQFWPNDLSYGSFEVIWGQIRVLPLTFDRIEIERWEWAQYVSFAKTHRMICNMTYLVQHVTSRDLDLRSNFEIDLFRSTCSYFDAFRREENDAGKIRYLAFLVQKLFAWKKLF